MLSKEILAQNWFFKDFSETQIDTLLALGREVSFPAGGKVVVEGEPAESFHILLQGTISIKMRVEEHGELVLNTLRRAGEIFGWSALVEEGHSTASTECLEEAKVLSFKKKDLEDLFVRTPDWDISS